MHKVIVLLILVNILDRTSSVVIQNWLYLYCCQPEEGGGGGGGGVEIIHSGVVLSQDD